MQLLMIIDYSKVLITRKIIIIITSESCKDDRVCIMVNSVHKQVCVFN